MDDDFPNIDIIQEAEDDDVDLSEMEEIFEQLKVAVRFMFLCIDVRGGVCVVSGNDVYIRFSRAYLFAVGKIPGSSGIWLLAHFKHRILTEDRLMWEESYESD